MFKIFVIVFLASGGHPVGSANGKHAYPTLEACQAFLAADASEPQSVAAYKAYVEERLGAKVRVAATCAEVREDGSAIHEEELPKSTEENPS